MKAFPFALLLALPFTLFAAEVKPGDSVERVRIALGAPRGQMEVRGRELFYYDRGEVELRSGVVTRVALRSADEQAALDARRSIEAERVRAEQEIRRARLSAERETLKARRLSDPTFLGAPVSYQVAFWEDFSRRYADVPSAEHLSVARARLAVEVAEKRVQVAQAERLAELENRVIQSEARTTEAYASTIVFPRRYYSSRRDPYDYRPYNPGPINYRLYESPLPYATSPGMPLKQPVYRRENNSLRYGGPENDFSRNGRSSWPQRSDSNRWQSRQTPADFRRD